MDYPSVPGGFTIFDGSFDVSASLIFAEPAITPATVAAPAVSRERARRLYAGR